MNEFKAANTEQEEAIAAGKEFISGGNSNEFFHIGGKAGTGKTTIAQEVVAEAIEKGWYILVMALSHKAKIVIQEKFEKRFGKKGNIVFKSVAGGLGMNMDHETGDFVIPFQREFEYEPPIKTAKVVVVDEGSMINEEGHRLIMTEKRDSAMVIYLGDIGQLPPIRKDGDKNKDKPSPTFITPNSVKLMERVRQGEESPILPYADLFWDNSQVKFPVDNPASPAHRKDVVTAAGALVFAGNTADVLEKVLPLYKKSIDDFNPNIIKTVVYRNVPRQSINNYIRQYLFKERASEQFMVGDLLIFADSYTVSGMKEQISNSSEIQVKSASSGKDGEKEFKVWNIDFVWEAKPTSVRALDVSELGRHERYISELFAIAKVMPKGKERTAALAKAWGEKKRYAPLEYAYAITSHKCQGSTYNTVIVGEGDIMAVKMTTAKAKSQSIYTAITRASTTVIVIDGQPMNNENVDKALELSWSKLDVVAEPVEESLITANC